MDVKKIRMFLYFIKTIELSINYIIDVLIVAERLEIYIIIKINILRNNACLDELNTVKWIDKLEKVL